MSNYDRFGRLTSGGGRKNDDESEDRTEIWHDPDNDDTFLQRPPDAHLKSDSAEPKPQSATGREDQSTLDQKAYHNRNQLDWSAATTGEYDRLGAEPKKAKPTPRYEANMAEAASQADYWETEADQPQEWETDAAEETYGSNTNLPFDHLLLWLVVREPIERRGTILIIPPEAILGRGRDVDVRWDDARMSRRHARFTLEPDPDLPDDPTLVYFIWPLEARNGILLNGRLLRGAQRLNENDELTMGETVFIVKTLA